MELHAGSYLIALVCVSYCVFGLPQLYTQDVLTTEAKIKKLIQKLESECDDKILQDINDLGEDASPVVPILIGYLKKETSLHARVIATCALRGIGKKAAPAVPALIQNLADQDFYVVTSAANTLIVIGDSAIPPLLTSVLGDHQQVKLMSIGILGEIRNPISIPTLIQLLQNNDEKIRCSTIRALGKIGKQSVTAIPSLKDLLGNDSLFVKREVLEALGNINAPSALEALTKALDVEHNSQLRYTAVEAIAKFKNEAISAIPALVLLLNEEKQVSSLVGETLIQMGDKALPLLRELQNQEKYGSFFGKIAKIIEAIEKRK